MKPLCDCSGIESFVRSCRKYEDRPAGECGCLESCCNLGRWAPDGSGYDDFIPEKNVCQCKEPQ